ncbi:MAG: iron-containing alcohol dehydrogenase [Lachnospiraceae bacterium]|jgi:alcohol dehydrogenase class IV|nr:iron-containing alcohol dehydrogenase [Lachnospiraceae bacterium]
MNIIKKCYCRTFQAAFRAIVPLLPYRPPRLIPNVSGLPDILKNHCCRRILIVTDPSISRLGLTRTLEKALTDNKILFFVYAQTNANPTSDNVEEVRSLYLKHDCDAIIGFGGGSSMDCAKAAGARIARPDLPLKKMKGILKIRKKLPLLIAVPTTAGTGSEATIAAVITDSVTRHKYSINDFPLIPSYAVLDPAITVSLPPLITATTGMDALTHAIEAYIGNTTTKDTRKAALKSVHLIFSSLEKAYLDGSDLQARRKMLIASYYAGCAFTKSYVGYVHAIAHSLGGQYNVPHGLANAVLLPFILEAYGSSIYKKLKSLAIAAGLADKNTPCKEAACQFIAAIHNMKRRFEIGNTIPEIQEKDIKKLAQYADKEANPLYPVPVLMNAKNLEQFYYLLMEDASF